MKNCMYALLTALIITSCSDKKADNNTHITGHIKGFTNGIVYLQKMNDTVIMVLDSVKMKGDSKFQFDFNLDSPELMYLFVDRGITNSMDDSLPIFAEQGTINVETDLKYFYASAKITGSKNQELFEEFQKTNRKYKGELLEISKEKFDALRFKRTHDVDSIETKFDKKLKRKYLYAINFALTNKEYEVAPYVALTELANANIKYLDTINKAMSPKVAESTYGKLLKKYISERQSEK